MAVKDRSILQHVREKKLAKLNRSIFLGLRPNRRRLEHHSLSGCYLVHSRLRRNRLMLVRRHLGPWSAKGLMLLFAFSFVFFVSSLLRFIPCA